MLIRVPCPKSGHASRRWAFAIAASVCSFLVVASAQAQSTPPAVTLGGGLRASFVHTAPADEDDVDHLNLESARLYVGGTVTKNIKMMFNTEYNGGTQAVSVIDAVARLEMSPKFNVWFGRFLPPSDRANLYGPYYSHHWAVYTDGVQDGYPFVTTGRDDGVAYWGQFGKVKLSGGIFDGASATGDDTLLTAARVQVDFWDAEEGYYQNGTYYGEKNLLALGFAVQAQGSEKKAYSLDFLLEQKVGEGGAYSIEAEWAKYDHLGGYSSRYGTDDGGYILASYLFPKVVGDGNKFEILGKFAKARFREGISIADGDFDQKTTEINFNYLIKQFNARMMIFFKDTRFDAERQNFSQVGVGLQIQM